MDKQLRNNVLTAGLLMDVKQGAIRSHEARTGSVFETKTSYQCVMFTTVDSRQFWIWIPIFAFSLNFTFTFNFFQFDKNSSKPIHEQLSPSLRCWYKSVYCCVNALQITIFYQWTTHKTKTNFPGRIIIVYHKTTEQKRTTVVG